MSKNVLVNEDNSSADKPTSGIARRSFLKAGVAAVAATAATAAMLEPLRAFSGSFNAQQFFQDHYRRLTPEMMERILERLEETIARDYGVKATISDHKPLENVEFAYALNLSRCNGSRKCVTACMAENNQSRNPEMQYIKVLELPNGSFNLEEGDQYYDREKVPEEGHFYLPVQCQQCKEPPCVKVCPVEATWQEPDGITVIDYDWCIGCRYCIAACPYEARRFNWSKPEIPKEEVNPEMGYLSNRIRPIGVVEKCHFCLHRTRQGKNPACMEACPTGARIFGNIRDPKSKIRYILENKRVYILKEEAGTLPRFFYFFDS